MSTERRVDVWMTDEARARVYAEAGWSFERGSTYADLVRMAGLVGFGGHFDEPADEATAALSAAAVDDDEFLWLSNSLESYLAMARDACARTKVPELPDSGTINLSVLAVDLRSRGMHVEMKGGPGGTLLLATRSGGRTVEVWPGVSSPAGPMAKLATMMVATTLQGGSTTRTGFTSMSEVVTAVIVMSAS
jgi:hypothetical protein